MNRFDSTVQTMETTLVPSATQEVWSVLVFASGGSGAIILGGAVFLLAIDMLMWERLRLFVVVAAVPWVFVGVLLILATWRQSVALLERLTDRDLDGSGQVGDIPDIRLVPVRGSGHTVGGVAPEDWRYFVTTICAVPDWTQRAWRRQQMPSGQQCDNDYWSLLTGGLKKINVIADAGPRSTGHLTTTDPAEILGMLGV